MAPATACTCTNDLACNSFRMAQVATTVNIDDVAYKVRDFAHISNGVNHVWNGNCASYETHATQNMPAIHHLPGQNKWGDKCAYITPGQSSVLTNGNNACGSFAPAGWARICCCARTGKNGGGTGASRAEDCPVQQSDCPSGTTYAHGFCGAATNAPTTAPTQVPSSVPTSASTAPTSAPTSSPTTSAPIVPPVNGGYTAWAACSVACGGGTETRLCSNPAPVGTGADCSGLGVASRECNPTACTGAPTTAPSNAPTTVPTNAPSNAPTTVPTTAPVTFAPTTAPIVVSANSAAAKGTEANAGATVGIVFGIIGGLLVLAIVAAAVAVIVFILFKKQIDAKKKGDDDDESAVDLSLEMGSMASASPPASFDGKLQKQASRFIGGNPMSAKKDFGIGGIDAEIKAEAREIVAASGIITGAAACASVMGSNPMKQAADFGIGGGSLHSSDSLSLSGDEDIEAPPAVQQQQQQQQATTEKKSRPVSMRADVDGTKYSKEQFLAHYGGSEGEWNQAKRTSEGGDDEDNEEAKKAARPVSMRTSMVREESFANALAGFGDDEDDGDQVVAAESLAPVVEEEEPLFAPPPAPPAAAATASGETMFSFGGEDDGFVGDEEEPMFAPPPAPPAAVAREEVMF